MICRLAARTNFLSSVKPSDTTTRLQTSRLFSTAFIGLSDTQSLSLSLNRALNRSLPKFYINPRDIRIIQSPGDFYKSLLRKIRDAQNHVFLSTLYIGKDEHELVAALRSALQRTPSLTLSILTDALRGTREQPEPSAAFLLAPLVSEFGADRVEIRMYHTPNLVGMRKRLIPKRINEGWGLQHMKLYGFDDELILSGANLSSDYFSNRQDRYHVFSSRAITSYYRGIHQAVCQLSFSVEPDGQNQFQLVWPASNPGPSPVAQPNAFVREATELLAPLIRPNSNQASATQSPGDTALYPIAQFAPLFGSPDQSTELPTISKVLSIVAEDSAITRQWIFTAGYFNVHPRLSELLLQSRSCQGTVITASPWANGFFGSRGISGLLPGAYTLLLRRFMQRVQVAGKLSQIQLFEWRRGTVGEPEGWTYHAKGIWLGDVGGAGPCATVIGSSNYTKRSYQLDLEVGAVVVTEDHDLRSRLKAEVDHLKENARETDIASLQGGERRVGLRVRLAILAVRLLGGEL